jgi:AraC-like DNA-binding protein
MTMLVRSASLTNFDEIVCLYGLDSHAMLAKVGLPARCLKELDLKVSVNAISNLLELAAEQSHEPAFGLLMAESRRLSNLGLLGLLLRDQPSLRDALNTVVQHIRVHNEAVLIQLETVDKLVFIREELILDGQVPGRQATELVLGVTFRMISLFMGANWRPQRVCFSHAAPQNLAVHRRVFGNSIEFGHAFNGIVCSAVELDSPNPSADPVMARYAKKWLEGTSQSNTTFEEQIRQMVLLLLPLGQCNAKVVAQHMACDRRTVSRRLATAGKSFHQLVNNHRIQLVKHYLAKGGKPLSEVSALIGFSSPSAFSRWYRQHFGNAARLHVG